MNDVQTGTMIFLASVVVLSGFGLFVETQDPKAAQIQMQAEQQAKLKQIEEENRLVQNKLPAGCSINYYGDYRYTTYNMPVPVIAVVCKKQDTTSLNWLSPVGKFRQPTLRLTVSE